MNNPQNANEILASFGISRGHLATVAKLGSLPNVRPDELVAAFYRWLDGQPWKAQFFGGGVPDRVQTAQIQYWREFLEAEVDDAYIESRIFVGATHARIGLPPKAYTTAMAFSQRWLVDAVRESGMGLDEQLSIADAVSALCQLDAALVMDAYADHSSKRIQSEADKLGLINDEVMRVMMAASEGDFAQRYQLQGETDSLLASAINQMIESLEATVRQAKAVAAGDYSSDVVPRSQKDELGRVLAEMTQKLRDATERTEQDQWMRQGHADVFERMRGELTTEDLSRAVLSYLAERLETPVGCIYVPEEDGRLRLAASYGAASGTVRRELDPGEGIVGEVALRKEPLYELDVSMSPVRGSFGLGEILLENVAIVPLLADGQLRGIVQFASLAPLDERARSFLGLIGENLAIGLGGAESRLRMRSLLEESQSQREALQSQAEELRVSNEELEERSQALQRTREDVQKQNEELRKQQSAIEISRAELEEKARELAVSSKYKSEFLANMSHELRTPLNSMLILAGNLCENPEGNLTDRQQESIDIIRSGGQDLLRIINDILDLSKVEAGKLSVEVAPASLGALVTSLRKQFEPVAARDGLELRFHLDPSAPRSILSDVQRVEQILKNLLSNALKFTAKGSVDLSIADATGDPRLRGELRFEKAVALAVRDTGVGIPEDKCAAIFEAFQQADGSTSRKYGGTGLGLAISRQLAELLGGEIHLQSSEGKGSTFTLFLPVAIDGARDGRSATGTAEAPREERLVSQRPQPMPSVSAPRNPSVERNPDAVRNGSPAAPPQRPTLLVVEDDPVFREMLATLVRDRGYDALTTGSGKEAILLAQRVLPKGIVLDLGLPDIDGMSVLEQLKDNLETRHIPVHVISGHDCRPDTLQLGAMGFLQKPTDSQQLGKMFERFEGLWARKTGRLLVVEDDPGSQTAIHELVGGHGVSIDTAESGSAGLAMLDSHVYDCVVIDLDLPDMDGAEFLGKLNSNHPPVVVYTAQDLSDSKLQALSEYTKSVVIKGVRSPDRLLDEVSLFLHQVDDELSEAQRSALRELHDPKATLQNKKVLVVDDDMRNVFALTELLQRHDLEVLKAKNGQVALDRLDADPGIDLVVMDIMMPVMDGFEAMRRIRAQERFAQLPIVAVTAKTLPEDRQACLEAGASDYITKPMDPSNLLALMRVLLFDAHAPGAGHSASGPTAEH